MYAHVHARRVTRCRFGLRDCASRYTERAYRGRAYAEFGNSKRKGVSSAVTCLKPPASVSTECHVNATLQDMRTTLASLNQDNHKGFLHPEATSESSSTQSPSEIRFWFGRASNHSSSNQQSSLSCWFGSLWVLTFHVISDPVLMEILAEFLELQFS